tara:strand:+ start:521 stop:682 length:162 start_codon:yes stop_codon:yes gene_type:complete
MKKFLILFLFIFTSCSPNNKVQVLNLSENMTFEEFKIKLDEYAKNNPYPNIDD